MGACFSKKKKKKTSHEAQDTENVSSSSRKKPKVTKAVPPCADVPSPTTSNRHVIDTNPHRNPGLEGHVKTESITLENTDDKSLHPPPPLIQDDSSKASCADAAAAVVLPPPPPVRPEDRPIESAFIREERKRQSALQEKSRLEREAANARWVEELEQNKKVFMPLPMKPNLSAP
jgi:hypothetical protein